jgi:hypothetical protein
VRWGHVCATIRCGRDLLSRRTICANQTPFFALFCGGASWPGCGERGGGIPSRSASGPGCGETSRSASGHSGGSGGWRCTGYIHACCTCYTTPQPFRWLVLAGVTRLAESSIVVLTHFAIVYVMCGRCCGRNGGGACWCCCRCGSGHCSWRRSGNGGWCIGRKSRWLRGGEAGWLRGGVGSGIRGEAGWLRGGIRSGRLRSYQRGKAHEHRRQSNSHADKQLASMNTCQYVQLFAHRGKTVDSRIWWQGRVYAKLCVR